MKLAYYQYDIVFGNKQANFNKLAKAVEGKKIDLLILPELFATGYMFSSFDEAKSYSESLDNSETCLFLKQLAIDCNAYIVGNLIESERGVLYNTAILIGSEGLIGTQRKLHLSKFEQKLFISGNKLNVFEIKGIKIGIAICFDLWFPEIARNLMQKGTQIICHPANFGGPNSLHISIARAVENRVFVITVNRLGNEKGESYRGESQIVSPDGEIIYKSANNEELIIKDIDPIVADSKNTSMADFNKEWEKIFN